MRQARPSSQQPSRVSSGRPTGLRRLVLCALLASGVWLSSATPAEAFVRIYTATNNPVKWTQMPISWYYNHNGFTQLSTQQMLQVINNAFAAWGAPGCSAVQAQYAGATTKIWSQTDATNVLLWNSKIPSAQFPQALALAIPTPRDNQGALIDADIIFNSTYSWSTSPSGQQFDVIGTVTHEIGHLLGLAHTNDASATMYPTANPGLCPCRQLAQDDINGICTIYPSGNTGQKGKVGDTCDQTNVCDTGLLCTVTQQGATTGICLLLCSGTCTSGETCTTLGDGNKVCACQKDADCSNGNTCQNFRCTGPPSNPNGGKLGDSCTQQTPCANGFYCLSSPPGAATGNCYQACTPGTTTCAGGEPCQGVGNGQNACLCENDSQCSGGAKCTNYRCMGSTSTGGAEGEACGVNDSCQAGLQCVANPFDQSQKVCLKVCSSSTECKQGWKCDETNKVCVPNLTQQRGQSCDPQSFCQAGLFCTVVQQNATSGVCLPLCTPQNLCQEGEPCLQLTGVNASVCACQKDSECPSGKTCKDLRCVGGSGCTSDTECPAGRSCQGGQCIVSTTGCQNDAQCSAGQSCQNGQCVASGCTSDAQCPPGQSCQNGQCATASGCATNDQCPSGQVCQNGQCTAPSGCTADAQCGQGQSCQNGACVPSGTNNNNNNNNNSICSPPCTGNQVCRFGACIAPDECTVDADCSGGKICKSGLCKENTTSSQGCGCNSASPATPAPLSLLLLLGVLLGVRRRWHRVR